MSRPFDCFNFGSSNCEKDEDDYLERHTRLSSTPSGSPLPKSDNSSPVPNLDLPEGVIELQSLKLTGPKHLRTKSHDIVRNLFSHVFGGSETPEIKLPTKEPSTPNSSPKISPFKQHRRTKSYEKHHKNMVEVFPTITMESPHQILAKKFEEIKKKEEVNKKESGLNLTDIPMTTTEQNTLSFHSTNSLSDENEEDEIDHPDIMKYMK